MLATHAPLHSLDPANAIGTLRRALDEVLRDLLIKRQNAATRRLDPGHGPVEPAFSVPEIAWIDSGWIAGR